VRTTDAVPQRATPATGATSGFDALEARLRDIRREAGLGDSAPASPVRAATAPVAREQVPDVVLVAASSGKRRAPAWDLLLLGIAWSGLVGLVALALQSV
jgi:hypothetical protein